MDDTATKCRTSYTSYYHGDYHLFFEDDNFSPKCQNTGQMCILTAHACRGSLSRPCASENHLLCVRRHTRSVLLFSCLLHATTAIQRENVRSKDLFFFVTNWTVRTVPDDVCLDRLPIHPSTPHLPPDVMKYIRLKNSTLG